MLLEKKCCSLILIHGAASPDSDPYWYNQIQFSDMKSCSMMDLDNRLSLSSQCSYSAALWKNLELAELEVAKSFAYFTTEMIHTSYAMPLE